MAKKPTSPTLTPSELAALDMIILKATEDGIKPDQKAKFIHAVANVADKAAHAVVNDKVTAEVGGLAVATAVNTALTVAETPELALITILAAPAARGRKPSAEMLRQIVQQVAGAPSVTLRELIALRRSAVAASRKTGKRAQAKKAPPAKPRKTKKRRR
jgi:hypothetical protein